MKLRVVMIAAVAAMLAVGAHAQQSDDAGRPAAGRHPRRAPGQRGRQSIFDRIRSQLDLSEEQQTKYDEIVAKYRRDHGGMNMQGMRKIMKEMREARKAGDNERVAELRKQLAESRKGSSLDAFFDELEPILNADQREKLASIRQNMRSRRGRGRGPVAQLEHLRGQLKLSDEQAAKYDELLDQLKEDLKSTSNSEQTQAVIKQIREAAEAGDNERVRELSRKLPNARRRNEQLVAAFLDDVEGFLKPNQKKILERYRRRMRSGRGQAEIRSWFRYVRRLDLSEEQRDTLRDIEKNAARKMRDARKNGESAATVAEDIKQQLRDMLTDEQVAQFDRWLDSQKDARGGRRPRHRRRGRHHGQTQDQTP